MPYIKKEDRTKVDRIYNIMQHVGIKADGDLNYLLFKYCKYNVKASYNSYKNFVGELRQCAVEIERRILAEYEDKKIQENGDV